MSSFTMAIGDIVGLLTVLGVVLGVYFLPAIVAARRGHPQQTPILLVDLFFGWTFLGWAIALIWAASYIDPAQVRARAATANPVVALCSKCGAENPPNATICQSCGVRFAAPPAVAP